MQKELKNDGLDSTDRLLIALLEQAVKEKDIAWITGKRDSQISLKFICLYFGWNYDRIRDRAIDAIEE